MYKFYLKSVALCAFLTMAFPTNAQEGKLPTDEETSWEHRFPKAWCAALPSLTASCLCPTPQAASAAMYGEDRT